MTCDPCLLRSDHIRCRIIGCECKCRLNGFRSVGGRTLRSGERAPSPRVAPAPHTGLFTTKEVPDVDDIPAHVTVRKGRYMTPEQRRWVHILRERDVPVQAIGKMLGGFGHPSVVRELQKGAV